MKKRLLITCTDMMMQQFLLPHVRYLRGQGWDVELACSEVGGKVAAVREALPGVPVYPVRLRRSPFWMGNILGFFDLKRRIKAGNYDIIWTNEPVMGVATRVAARKSRAKILYLCHGFHFYRGGSFANWLLFYPVEYVLSRWTDLLVTINREDAALAQRMRAGRTAYIHGIGLDIARLEGTKSHIREELGLRNEDFLVLSVGELNKNKDHQTALRAIAALADRRIHYAICGKGPLLKKLQRQAKRLGIGDRVHFLGYRRDLSGIYAGADLLLHPSRREGLGLAVLEGKYCGLAVVASDTRGIRDFAGEKDILVKPGDAAAFARAVQRRKSQPVRCLWNQDAYLLENSQKEMKELLGSL